MSVFGYPDMKEQKWCSMNWTGWRVSDYSSGPCVRLWTSRMVSWMMVYDIHPYLAVSYCHIYLSRVPAIGKKDLGTEMGLWLFSSTWWVRVSLATSVFQCKAWWQRWLHHSAISTWRPLVGVSHDVWVGDNRGSWLHVCFMIGLSAGQQGSAGAASGISVVNGQKSP